MSKNKTFKRTPLNTSIASSLALMLLAPSAVHAEFTVTEFDISPFDADFGEQATFIPNDTEVFNSAEPTIFTLDAGGVINFPFTLRGTSVSTGSFANAAADFIDISNPVDVFNSSELAFEIGDNLLINNNGNIDSSADAAGSLDLAVNTAAISISANPDSTVAINNTGSISNSGSNAISLSAALLFGQSCCNVNLTIENEGSISSTVSNSDNLSDFFDTFVNTVNDAAISFGDNTVITGSVNNSGNISGFANGISFNDATAEHDLIITNSLTGTIQGNNGSGVVIRGSGITLNNFGDISGNTGLTFSRFISETNPINSDEIQSDQLNTITINDVTIINDGNITSDDLNSSAIFFEEYAAVSGSITNNGSIFGSSNGIFISGAVVDHNLTITNTTEGSIFGGNGSAVSIAGAGITLNNFGDIFGDIGLTITDTQIGSVESASQTVLAQNNTLFLTKLMVVF